VAKHVPVHRMGEPELPAATIGRHRHQPRFLQGLEHPGTGRDLVRVRPERRAQRQQLERPPAVLPHTCDPCGDEVVQSRRAAQWAGQPPDAVVVDQRPRLLGAEHQLAEEQHVAEARCPQGMGGRAVDGCPEREMQERLDAVPGKVVEVDPMAAVITPESGHRRAGTPVAAHRPDKEDGAGHEQLPQERRGG